MSQYIDNLDSIEKKFSNKSIKKILFISGNSSYYKTSAEKIFKNIFKNKKKFLFIKKSYYPQIEELTDIIKMKQRIKPDLIVAIGGGCVLDYSKISSVYDIEKNFKKKLLNSDYNSKKKVKVLAIPTTAGSGAEVTSNAVLYIDKIKYSIEGPEIRPEYYSLIPKLLLSSSFKIDSSSGFDAISQAIESIVSVRSNYRSVEFAKRALKILLKNFDTFLKNKNLFNSYKMALGANLAGKAINISKTTAPHALSYPFTAHFDIPHGHAVSLTLNKFLKFNYKYLDKSNCNFDLRKRFHLLFSLTKTKNIDELDVFLRKIKRIAALEQNFSKLNIDINNNYDKIASGLNDQRLANNPIKILKKDIKHILENY